MRDFDREKKNRSAERLFDAIGMIDDRIIADASDAYISRASSKPVFLRRYLVSLTSVLLVVAMACGVVVANLSNTHDSESLKDSMTMDEGEARQTLDFVLNDVTDTPNVSTVLLDEIDFFDGEVSLIWNYGVGEEYHKLTFEGENAESIVKNCMSKSVVQISAEVADETVCNVWVSYGNGEVVSPYLKESLGNIGYAELFEYSPEVMPSESFTDLVRDALNY